MTNNNVNLRHRAPATLADQGEPHAPQQIAHNEPERPLIGAQDNPNRAPGWINRIQRAWQQGTNAIRENGDALAREAVRVGPFAVYGAVATWGVEGIYHYDDKDYIPHRGPKYAAVAAAALIVIGWIATPLLRRQQDGIDHLRQNDLAGKPLDEVINEFRTQRASSSSASAPAFDWSQPELFVNQEGQDVAHEVSHFLNRILYAIKNETEQNKAENHRDLNSYLDLLEQDPAVRTALADCVYDLNQACFNRNAQSINSILRQMRAQYPEGMPFKDFMLAAMLEMALTEADKKLIDFMKKKGMEQPVVESQQAFQGDVLRTLRKKLSELPHQLERVYQGTDNCVELTGEERRKFSEEVVKTVTDPMECARLLQTSTKENAYMKKHFADELIRSNVDAPLSDENREKAYAELARQNGKVEIDLDEMTLVDENLQHERDIAVQTVYAKQIKDFLEGVMTSN